MSLLVNRVFTLLTVLVSIRPLLMAYKKQKIKKEFLYYGPKRPPNGASKNKKQEKISVALIAWTEIDQISVGPESSYKNFYTADMKLKKLIQRNIQAAAAAVKAAVDLIVPDTTPAPSRKRKRVATQRLNWAQSPAWILLQKGEYRDHNSADGKAFRRRYRLPGEIFDRIVSICKARRWFDIAETDASNRATAPIELKILGVLRVLGRGWVFDDLEEITGLKRETHRKFFHEFCKLVFFGDV